jgi:hypothetical protein
MEFDYETFRKNLKKITSDTFIKCQEKVNPEEISGFALYSDNSAMTISISLNTFDYLKEMNKEEPGYNEYFKWTPGEWKYEMINAKEFEKLNLLLQKTNFDVDDINFSRHRNEIYNISVRVLEELRLENTFRRMTDNFVLMFAVSDFSEPDLEISYFKRLNKESESNNFEKWIIEEEKNKD